MLKSFFALPPPTILEIQNISLSLHLTRGAFLRSFLRLLFLFCVELNLIKALLSIPLSPALSAAATASLC